MIRGTPCSGQIKESPPPPPIFYNPSVQHLTYAWKGNCLTTSSSPPSGELFFASHTPRGSTLICDPINVGKAIRGVIISTSSSDTGCELGGVYTLNPGCSGLVHDGGIRIIKVINSKLNVDFLVRIKYERIEGYGFTLILCPGRDVPKLMSSFLKWKT